MRTHVYQGHGWQCWYGWRHKQGRSSHKRIRHTILQRCGPFVAALSVEKELFCRLRESAATSRACQVQHTQFACLAVRAWHASIATYLARTATIALNVDGQCVCRHGCSSCDLPHAWTLLRQAIHPCRRLPLWRSRSPGRGVLRLRVKCQSCL